MEDLITYNLETTLRTPAGVKLQSVTIKLDIDPHIGICVLYGWMADGNMGVVEVRGSKASLTLPFVQPQLYVAYLDGVQLVMIETLSWTEADEPAAG